MRRRKSYSIRGRRTARRGRGRRTTKIRRQRIPGTPIKVGYRL